MTTYVKAGANFSSLGSIYYVAYTYILNYGPYIFFIYKVFQVLI